MEQTSDNKNEECYRAAFAPDENVLAPEYSEQAVKFFKVSRQPMKMFDLIQWALDPDNNDQKTAILFYLLNGKKGEEIAQAFKTKTSGWRENLELTDELFDRLEKDEEKIAVFFKLKQSELFKQFRKNTKIIVNKKSASVNEKPLTKKLAKMLKRLSNRYLVTKD